MSEGAKMITGYGIRSVHATDVMSLRCVRLLAMVGVLILSAGMHTRASEQNDRYYAGSVPTGGDISSRRHYLR
ncbi:hypothetical protein DAEQUDRAFT_728124 [Daedalea quercina L-15889]|uniref:Uncharacterized protein n=1 Tax=Daedalea quercina L-15889 TaxID=1314783 RepID=A0A165PKD2_9APHY|nr:hypothetical protein DAEQUDRAFT_728124 [Daedalea quercina L-15889]